MKKLTLILLAGLTLAGCTATVRYSDEPTYTHRSYIYRSYDEPYFYDHGPVIYRRHYAHPRVRARVIVRP